MTARHAAPVAVAGLQSLEARRLLAALVVDGTTNADQIRLAVSASQILVTLNGVTTTHDDAAYDGVSINGGDGADTIVIDSNGLNRTSVTGGAGADVVKLGATAHSADGVTARVVATSSDGIDSLLLDDSANDASDGYTFYADGLIDRGGGFGGVMQTGFANVTVDAGPGGDVMVVFGTPTSGTYRLLSGVEDDQVDVRSTHGATVVVDTGEATDQLIINSDLGTPATVRFETTQDLSSMDMYPGATLAITGTAGLLLSTNTSSLEGDILLDRGFIIERGSQTAAGLEYYRDRLRNGPGAPTAGTPRLYSPHAVSSAASDAIGYGYAQNIAPTSIGGTALQSGDLVLRYTLQGDADLNQTVDFNDLLALARNYNGTGKSWAQGDSDLDGDVDFDDLLALARNYQKSVPVA